jgi:hypothetical protein
LGAVFAATTGGVGVGVVCCTCVVDGCDCWQEIMTELAIATTGIKYLRISAFLIQKQNL